MEYSQDCYKHDLNKLFTYREFSDDEISEKTETEFPVFPNTRTLLKHQQQLAKSLSAVKDIKSNSCAPIRSKQSIPSLTALDKIKEGYETTLKLSIAQDFRQCQKYLHGEPIYLNDLKRKRLVCLETETPKIMALELDEVNESKTKCKINKLVIKYDIQSNVENFDETEKTITNSSETQVETLNVIGGFKERLPGFKPFPLTKMPHKYHKKTCPNYAYLRRIGKNNNNRNSITQNVENADTITTPNANDNSEEMRWNIPYSLDQQSELEEDLKKATLPSWRTRIVDSPNITLSIWKLVKENISKDLFSISVPVNFCEPLSGLQRMTENFIYTELLDKASTFPNDPLEELVNVAGFVVSTHAYVYTRLTKPFNPLLGETYECDRLAEAGWRSIAEQVSHHPPISAMYCESKDWRYWQEFKLSLKFTGKCLIITPTGTTHILFPKSGSHYAYRNVPTYVYNLILGTTFLDLAGKTDIVNYTNNYRCQLDYAPYTIFNKADYKKVTGTIQPSPTDPISYILKGVVDSHLKGLSVKSTDAETIKSSYCYQLQKLFDQASETEKRLIWRHTKLADSDSNKYYNLSPFAISLNERCTGVSPTDSRNRLDIRLMENGLWTEANSTKQELELAQRSVEGLKAPLKWFSLKYDPQVNELFYAYNGEYWRTRHEVSWTEVDNLAFKSCENNDFTLFKHKKCTPIINPIWFSEKPLIDSYNGSTVLKDNKQSPIIIGNRPAKNSITNSDNGSIVSKNKKQISKNICYKSTKKSKIDKGIKTITEKEKQATNAISNKPAARTLIDRGTRSPKLLRSKVMANSKDAKLKIQNETKSDKQFQTKTTPPLIVNKNVRKSKSLF